MTDPPAGLHRRIGDVRRRIEAAAASAGRDPAAVSLLLATKTVSPDRIAAAVRAGCPLIGENRAQELIAKAPELAAALAAVDVERHFIGRLQTNKITSVLPLVGCVQSVHSVDLALRLGLAAAAAGRTLDVFVQVNVSGEDSKSGVAPAAAAELAAEVLSTPALRLRGLMTIGLNSADRTAVAAGYRQLADLGHQVASLPGAPPTVELSMGMSGDLELAVAAGATMVRIGSAVFGARVAPAGGG